MFRRTLVVLLMVAIAFTASAGKRRAIATPSLWNGLTPGPVPIGFKGWLLRAQASEFHHGPQHLVQVNVWYPAIANGGTAMTFRDYVLLKTTENTYDEPTDATRQAALSEFRGPQVLLDTPMLARLNSPTPINVTRSPIVFFAVDEGESPADVAVLAEFIASHGYIVVTTPSVTRLTANDAAARAQEQADDIDRAASAIGDWPNAVNVPVSVVGAGLGLEAARLYATQHPVNLVLDRTAPAEGILQQLNAVWDSSTLTAEFLQNRNSE